MTLRHFEHFVAVCEAGGIGEGARRVHAAQSTVSAAIQDLEQQLGVDLLVRRPGGIAVPTPAGRLLLIEARSLLDHADDLDRLATDLRDEIVGEITLGSTASIAALIVGGVVAGFRDAYPGVRLITVEGSQADLLGGLADGRLELAVAYDLELSDDVAFETLSVLPPLVLLAAEDPLAQRKTVSLAALAKRDFILLDLPLTREYFASLFAAGGSEPRITHRTPHLEVVRSFVANGLGYSIVNAIPIAEKALDGMPLVTRPLAGTHRPLRLGIASRQGARDRRSVAVLRAFIRTSVHDSEALHGR